MSALNFTKFLLRCIMYLFCSICSIYIFATMNKPPVYDFKRDIYTFMMVYSIITFFYILLVFVIDTNLYFAAQNHHRHILTLHQLSTCDDLYFQLRLAISIYGIFSLVLVGIMAFEDFTNIPDKPVLVLSYVIGCINIIILFIQHNILWTVCTLGMIVCKIIDILLRFIMYPAYDSFAPTIRQIPQNNPDQNVTSQGHSTNIQISDNLNECNICYEHGKISVIMKCNHTMCIDCAKQWLTQKKQCPFCRSSDINIIPVSIETDMVNELHVQQIAQPEVIETNI